VVFRLGSPFQNNTRNWGTATLWLGLSPLGTAIELRKPHWTKLPYRNPNLNLNPLRKKKINISD
jgi:hypothetical protein